MFKDYCLDHVKKAKFKAIAKESNATVPSGMLVL